MNKYILALLTLISLSAGSVNANGLDLDPEIDQLVEHYLIQNKERYQVHDDKLMNSFSELLLFFPEYSLTSDQIQQFKKYGLFYIDFACKFAQKEPELLALLKSVQPDFIWDYHRESLEVLYNDLECDQSWISFDQFERIFIITNAKQDVSLKFHSALLAFIKEELTKHFSH